MTTLRLHELTYHFKLLFTGFLITASIGFSLGAFFVEHTTRLDPEGVSERIKGTEALDIDLDELPAAREIHYEKSNTDLLNITHTHIIAMTMLFVLVGAIFAFTTMLPAWLKSFFIIEPFVSILITFGGMWLLRYNGMGWSWVIMASGILMTLCFYGMVLVSIVEMWRHSKPKITP